MVSCEGIRELAQAYLDGDLAAQERERLARHLQACPVCRHVVDTYQALFAALAVPALPEASASFVVGALARVAAARRRRRAWQAVAIAAAIAAAAVTAVLLTGACVPGEVSAVADAAESAGSWQTAWASATALVSGAAAGGADWLQAIPGGPGALALIVAALGIELFLAYRWRALARVEANRQSGVV